ncbi:7 transmembrane receptor (rhodopsin family) protein [Acanthocheilonema viteae]
MISLKLTKIRLLKKQTRTCSFYREQTLRRRLHVNRMLISMVRVFACCWMPTVVFNFLKDYRWLPYFVNEQE